jgi:hypothetical protein
VVAVVAEEYHPPTLAVVAVVAALDYYLTKLFQPKHILLL